MRVGRAVGMWGNVAVVCGRRRRGGGGGWCGWFFHDFLCFIFSLFGFEFNDRSTFRSTFNINKITFPILTSHVRICMSQPRESSSRTTCIAVSVKMQCVAMDASLLLWGDALRLGRGGAMLLCCVGYGCCIVCSARRVVCAEVCLNIFMFQFFTAVPERPFFFSFCLFII